MHNNYYLRKRVKYNNNGKGRNYNWFFSKRRYNMWKIEATLYNNIRFSQS